MTEEDHVLWRYNEWKRQQLTLPLQNLAMCFALKILQEGQDGIVVVLESCGTNFTFIMHGAEAEFIGQGDLHDESYNELVLVEDIAAIHHEDESNQQCHHTLHIFPSDTLKSTYETNKPWQYTLIVVAIFVFSVLMFFVYDYYVANRQMKTEKKASKSSAIIQELFPGSVALQLFDKEKNSRENRKTEAFGDCSSSVENERSIAEFYPEATVLFADIAGKCNAEWRLKSTLFSMTNPHLICTCCSSHAGFTAWSSIREPQSVFMLLENIFQSFDGLAKKYGVFKVETIGGMCFLG